MNMENLYKFRSVLRDLYMRETSLNGDLVSDLYNNIDSSKAKSVYIAIQDFQISVTLFENCNICNFNLSCGLLYDIKADSCLWNGERNKESPESDRGLKV